MSCVNAMLSQMTGRYICDFTGEECHYMLPNWKKCKDHEKIVDEDYIAYVRNKRKRGGRTVNRSFPRDCGKCREYSCIGGKDDIIHECNKHEYICYEGSPWMNTVVCSNIIQVDFRKRTVVK